MLDYIKDGNEIYQKSFATIRAEVDLSQVPADIEKLVVRIIHASGMTDIINSIAYSEGAGAIGRAALKSGAPILCDAKMVAEGVTRSRLPANNDIICTLNDNGVREHAIAIKNTRSAAAIELWKPYLANSVVSIGNAPTALFHLLNMIEQGFPRPALIIGFPVGFIGAAESKQALADSALKIPYIVVHGRRGGSAMAAAAINALSSDKE